MTHTVPASVVTATTLIKPPLAEFATSLAVIECVAEFTLVVERWQLELRFSDAKLDPGAELADWVAEQSYQEYAYDDDVGTGVPLKLVGEAVARPLLPTLTDTDPVVGTVGPVTAAVVVVT